MNSYTQKYEDNHHRWPRYCNELSTDVKWWLRGVFEGGGAKGVAYQGALQGVEAYNCWFEAVAGSSAGAITAALIAAGYSSKDLGEPMKQLLELFRFPGFFSSVKSLRTKGEIIQRDAFREKLNELLTLKRDLFGFELSTGELTFEQLYAATGIELYVVAADVSRQEPVVFHHRYTPQCQVADAVVASASIPFAFDGGMLTADSYTVPVGANPGSKKGIRVFRTIVDGGVWTNLPMFVFKDPTFHTYMDSTLGLKPDMNQPLTGPVVGFMLHELVDDEGGEKDEATRRTDLKAAYIGARFEHGKTHGWDLAPTEQIDSTASRREQRPTLPTGDAWQYGRNARRWPHPKHKAFRNVLVWVDKTLLFTSQSWVVAIAITGLVLSEWLLFSVPGKYLWEMYQEELANGGWVGIGVITFFAIIYIVQLSFVVLLFLGALVGNWGLLLPFRRSVYGLAKTLIATPGTAPWEHLRHDVIALEIPASLTTLEVPDDPTDIIKRAKAKTEKRLTEILEPLLHRE